MINEPPKPYHTHIHISYIFIISWQGFCATRVIPGPRLMRTSFSSCSHLCAWLSRGKKTWRVAGSFLLPPPGRTTAQHLLTGYWPLMHHMDLLNKNWSLPRPRKGECKTLMGSKHLYLNYTIR